MPSSIRVIRPSVFIHEKINSNPIINDNKAVVRVQNDMIPRLIGKKGKTIKELEDKLGISIEVSPKITTLGREIEFEKEETGAYLVFTFPENIKENRS